MNDRKLDSLTYNRVRQHLAQNEFAPALELILGCQGDRVVELLGEIAGSAQPEESVVACREICIRGAGALGKVLRDLEKRSFGFRERLFAGLEKLFSQSAPLLLSLTESRDEEVYYWSLEALCRIRPEGFQDRLAARLRSGSRERRLHAARAAGKIGAVGLAAELLGLLSDPFGSVRDEAYSALAMMGKPAVDSTLALLGNVEDGSRDRCLDLIAEISGKDSAAPLRSMLETIDSRRLDSLVRIGSWSQSGAAGEGGALARLCRKIASGPVDLYSLVRADDTLGLSLEALELLKSDDAEARYWGAALLGILGIAETSGKLLSALKSEASPTVRRALITALGRTGTGDETGLEIMGIAASEQDGELLASIILLTARRASGFPTSWYLEYAGSSETVVRRAALTVLELRSFPWSE